MIRHKRVHTNERPFKCKYCNRTSKWKADLIRHVAKTHGIRVVSKYSRSKAFDVHHELKEEENGCGKEEHRRQPKSSSSISSSLSSSLSSLIKENPSSSSSSSTTSSQLPAFRCLMCFFEQDSIDQLILHLHTVHNLSPFECLQCKQTFDEASAASEHCTAATCTPLSIKINFSPVCLQSKSYF
uniref:C2H2-type domain-containing protein n=1 Tax=Panagrolaimus sp. ES5 TaxID=591445 RepID=A0AC34FZW8_9BILA